MEDFTISGEPRTKISSTSQHFHFLYQSSSGITVAGLTCLVTRQIMYIWLPSQHHLSHWFQLSPSTMAMMYWRGFRETVIMATEISMIKWWNVYYMGNTRPSGQQYAALNCARPLAHHADYKVLSSINGYKWSWIPFLRCQSIIKIGWRFREISQHLKVYNGNQHLISCYEVWEHDSNLHSGAVTTW